MRDLGKLDMPAAEVDSKTITSKYLRKTLSRMKTMLLDPSSEMARYAEITARNGMKIYFADTQITWP